MTEITRETHPNLYRVLDRINATSDPMRTMRALSAILAEPVFDEAEDAAQEVSVAFGDVVTVLDDSCAD